MSHILIGKRVVKVSINGDHDTLLFELAVGPAINAKFRSECCSTTWVESIDAPDALIGTVRSVENLDLPGFMKEIGDMQYLQYYGCKITTDNGTCVIDYRNSSNGYYGGDLDWPEREWEVEDDAKDRTLNEQEDPGYYEWKTVAQDDAMFPSPE